MEQLGLRSAQTELSRSSFYSWPASFPGNKGSAHQHSGRPGLPTHISGPVLEVLPGTVVRGRVCVCSPGSVAPLEWDYPTSLRTRE